MIVIRTGTVCHGARVQITDCNQYTTNAVEKQVKKYTYLLNENA